MTPSSQTSSTSGNDADADHQLFQVAASTEDDDRRRAALNEIVERHLHFAHRQAFRYAGRGIALDDLKQVAALALTCAARRYDPAKGISFLSFAAPTVRGELRKYFRDHGWAVRPTRTVQELQARVMEAQEALTQDLGRTPTTDELAEHLGEPPERVTEALTTDGCFLPLSLDKTIDRTESLTLGESIVCEDDPFVDADFRVMCKPAIRSLKPRDRQILMLRFFGGLTQAEIAERVGTTQMTVSRALGRIIRDLRRAMGVQTAPSAGQDAAQAA